MKKLSALALAVVAAALLGAAAPAAPVEPARYDASGRMRFPADYRTWVFLSSGLNMSYSATPAMAGQDMFGNSFVQPAAYAAFGRTGTWPDGTMIVLENRGGANKGSINKRGLFQTTDYMGAEVHVKNVARFKGGWAFFAFGPEGEPAPQIPVTERCYSCHQEHAAVDTTFVQFYPTLLPIAARLGTLSKSYLAEPAAPRPGP